MNHIFCYFKYNLDFFKDTAYFEIIPNILNTGYLCVGYEKTWSKICYDKTTLAKSFLTLV